MFATFGATAGEGVLTVGKGGDFASIQAAVDHVASGASIVVRAGTYRERVVVDKALTLSAEGAVVIDAGRSGSAVTLSGSSITFTGFEVRNAGSAKTDAGLFISGNGNTVSRVKATANNFGIVVSGGHDNAITDSAAVGNKHDGIAVLGAVSTTVTGNRTEGNGRAGIWLAATHVGQVMQEAVGNRVGDNETRKNRSFGIALNTGANRNEITANRVEANGRAMSDAGILLNCGPNDNLVESNILSRNQRHGILVMSGAFSNRIIANSVTGSANGIGIYDANSNEIASNTVTGSADYGIRLDDMSPLMGGAGKVPGIAGAFPVSSLNTLFRNDMAENRVNAFDRSGTPWSPPGASKAASADLPAGGQMLEPNRWDNGAEGNHYDDFDEEREGFLDRNGDGIGDNVHAIPGGAAVDHFPLAQAVGTN
jgi:parallel beta-helix repeat protein